MISAKVGDAKLFMTVPQLTWSIISFVVWKIILRWLKMNEVGVNLQKSMNDMIEYKLYNISWKDRLVKFDTYNSRLSQLLSVFVSLTYHVS